MEFQQAIHDGAQFRVDSGTQGQKSGVIFDFGRGEQPAPTGIAHKQPAGKGVVTRDPGGLLC